jgi:hypothetical protein
MHLLRQTSIWFSLLAAITIAAVPEAVAGVILITPEEAKLPAPTQIETSRAITQHAIRIEMKDTEGRVATTSFLLAVAPE